MNGEFPPPGTKCVDCKCCLAAVYAGNDPVCWECDSGVPCKGRQAAPTVDKMAKVDKIADLGRGHSARTSIKVARLLKPRKTTLGRRHKVTLSNNLPPAVEIDKAGSPGHRRSQPRRCALCSERCRAGAGLIALPPIRRSHRRPRSQARRDQQDASYPAGPAAGRPLNRPRTLNLIGENEMSKPGAKLTPPKRPTPALNRNPLAQSKAISMPVTLPQLRDLLNTMMPPNAPATLAAERNGQAMTQAPPKPPSMTTKALLARVIELSREMRGRVDRGGYAQ